ncbi:hypothetical protein OROGR_007244 [Orobanche gracilis]
MNQGETSSGPSIHPLKRRRGRPPKDPNLKRPAPIHIPPDLDGVKHYLPSRSDPTASPQSLVGQSVSGVVEATLDAGYLLNVRIGNSPTNFRGIVFKPGHYVPVTAENDVAPHLQMIKRNDLYAPTADNLAIQMVPPKRKYKSRRAALSSVVPPVGVRGNVVPVVLQPVNNYPNGLPNSNQPPPRTGQVLNFGDKDVHMVEPLSMLPSDRSIPAGQIFLGGQLHASHRVSRQTSDHTNEKEPFHEEEKVKTTMESSEVENGGSSETSDSLNENGEECLKSPMGESDSGTFLSTQETGNCTEQFSTEALGNVSVVTKPVFSCGPGRMIELLQAVEENKKEGHERFSDQPTPSSKVGLREPPTTAETGPKNEASGP